MFDDPKPTAPENGNFEKDAHWKAGFIYWNPNDPAILVPKRFGIGCTLNFANKWSWIALIALVVAVWISSFLFHRR
jgi:uncharacterized membrane protein